jgi:DmsE family decaheme c-type cytochrome
MMLFVQALFLLAILAPPQNPYVGAQECAVCHEDISRAFRANPHTNTEQKCEACHGPGREHAESADIETIRSFRTLSPQKTSATCLACHQKEDVQSNRLFDVHSRQAVSCTSCHSIHTSYVETPLLEKPVNSLCATCHLAQRLRFDWPFTHKLSVGAMNCVNCHTPHGAALPIRVQMRTSHSNENGCYTCHGDVRGPFTFEHMPVKVEGCSACHEPHGSANPRMLIRNEVRQLCLECHTNSASAFGGTPPAFHDLRSDRFRNCTICHTKIHGSQTSRALLR